MDLEGKPKIPALVGSVQSVPLCTTLAHQGASVQTVEHLLSALRAFEMDNVLIEIDGPEIPICDGSSLAFIDLIRSGGIDFQQEVIEPVEISKPVFWSQGDIHLVALPSKTYRISYTLHYPHSPLIGSQFFSIVLSEESFEKEIAPSRTFSLYEEIAPMIERGLIKGGGLESALVVQGDKILNPEGARFPNEMVRHKILDLIGDLSLVGFPFVAHIIAIRSGHASNRAFAKEIVNSFGEG